MNASVQRSVRLDADRRGEVDSQCPLSLAHNQAKIHEWLLRLLRFAITHDASDQVAAFTAAEEMDAVGLRGRPSGPTFFIRTTKETCAAILSSDGPARSLILKKHLQRIDEPRLKRAFEAALGFDASQSLAKARSGRGPTKPIDLWKGLQAGNQN